MKSTKINKDIQNALLAILKKYPVVNKIVCMIHEAGGIALLVGGAVRDLLLGRTIKDLDIEVHNISIEKLEQILEYFDEVILIGKSFGVLRVRGLDVDWSLPRVDAAGRKPEVIINPKMGYEQAFKRRDLTINAMGIDLTTFELIDPFNGLDDLQNGILKATSESLFLEDPLRFYRVMQFIGRFEMYPNQELNDICKEMDVTHVSVERIEAEFDKLFLKSKRPSLGIRWIKDIGRLKELFPELAALVGVSQNPDWHPEGDVFEHTMQTLDAAAAIECANDADKLTLMYAALCHDLGKATTTHTENGIIKSEQHAQEGLGFTRQLLSRITKNKELKDTVCKLVLYHMAPVQFIDGGAKLSAYKRLANKLAPQTNLKMLADLALADKRGRNPKGHEPLTIDISEIDEFRKQSQKAQVELKKEEPILHGKDIMDIVEPGPQMGELLKRAYEIQIEEGIANKDELKRRIFKKD